MSRVQAPDVCRFVATSYGVTRAELVGVEKMRRISRPRQIAMTLVREFCNLSLTKTGRLFRRDHTTVVAAQRRVAQLEASDQKFAHALAAMREIIRFGEVAARPMTSEQLVTIVPPRPVMPPLRSRVIVLRPAVLGRCHPRPRLLPSEFRFPRERAMGTRA